MQYMTDLLALIEASDIPAPSPIEQRWSRRSASPMSPAHSAGEDDLHSWVRASLVRLRACPPIMPRPRHARALPQVGIIMYLPIDRPEARQAITDAFWDYNAVCRRQLWPKYDAHQHWAKIEPPADAAERAAVRRRLRDRFPVGELVGGAPSRTCPRDRPRLVSRRWTSSTRRAGSLTRRIFSATGCSMRCSRRTRDNIESRTSRGDTRACAVWRWAHYNGYSFLQKTSQTPSAVECT